ncbi:MAG: Na+/H+ antiporter subunit E [Opitutales bacterium]
MKVVRLCNLLAFYTREVVLSNLRVARDVLSPKYRIDPAFFSIELDQLSDLQISILANLITMTPGTLSLDVSPDRRHLYIHTMYAASLDTLKQQLKSDYEQRVKRVF